HMVRSGRHVQQKSVDVIRVPAPGELAPAGAEAKPGQITDRTTWPMSTGYPFRVQQDQRAGACRDPQARVGDDLRRIAEIDVNIHLRLADGASQDGEEGEDQTRHER